MASKQSATLWAQPAHHAEPDMAYAFGAALILTLLVIAIISQVNVKSAVTQVKQVTQVQLVQTPPPQKITQTHAETKSEAVEPPKPTAPAPKPQPAPVMQAQALSDSPAPRVETSPNPASQPSSQPAAAIEAPKPVAAMATPAANAAPSKSQASAPPSIGVACPSQVKPIMPRRALQEDISGSVTARATIRGGKVINVEIVQAKPRGMFEAAVRTAMLQYQCENSTDEVVAEQVFDFGPE